MYLFAKLTARRVSIMVLEMYNFCKQISPFSVYDVKNQE